MIAAGLERIGQVEEELVAVVVHERGLAVHRRGIALERAAVVLDEALVSEADAEERRRIGQTTQELGTDARVARTARPGAQHDRARLQREHAVDRERVVALHEDLDAETGERLVHVPGERVVVVEQEDHGFALFPSRRFARDFAGGRGRVRARPKRT